MSTLRPAFTVLRRSYVPCLTKRFVQTRFVSSTTAASTSEVKPNTVKVEPQQQQQQQQQKLEEDPRLPMLRATMSFIPEYGWSMESLIHGAKSLGYPSVAHGMFPGGEAGLIDAYLADTRKTFIKLVKEKLPELEGLPTNEKVKILTALRLDLNKPYIKRWPEALAIMARPSNVQMSLEHLHNIVDDIWYYAGDRSPDMNWYTKRASLAAVYSASDLFMTRDLSPNYSETQRFLNRRLDDAEWLGSSARQLGIMLSFGAKSALSALANRGGKY